MTAGRIRCACGEWVYTVKVRGVWVFPAKCPACGRPTETAEA